MIKEWCENCCGCNDGYETINNPVNCPKCDGKGYTELEPVYKGIERNFSMKVYDVNEDSFWYALRTPEKFEVYIKELKSE